MATVRVGTLRFSDGAPVAPGEDADHEVQAHWVEIGGVRLTAEDHALISVDYHADGSGASTVTLVLGVSSFETVHKDA